MSELDDRAGTRMTPEEAVDWLRSVDGELYRAPGGRGAARAWVAVVRTPGAGARRGKLIVALGETALEAASAANSEWQRIWRRAGRLH